MLLGATISGTLLTFLHEIGHVVFGKKNGFDFMSMCILFFKWEKVKGKISFSFTIPANQLGYTEMVPKYPEDIQKRYVKMSLGPLYFTVLPCLLGIVPLFLNFLPIWAYCLWASFLPIGAYSILDNFLPAEYEGEKNDGAVVLGMKRQDDSSKVTSNLLIIQANLYQGKIPSQIDKDIYFALPQLPEDDPNFFRLLNARYNYYLDLGDFENAKKTTERLLSLEEYFSPSYMCVAKADALYNACTFDYDEDVADDLTYELEKYLNKFNTCTNLRIKSAYILRLQGDKDVFDNFYKKGKKDALNCQIKGLGLFEIKLLDKLKQDYYEI